MNCNDLKMELIKLEKKYSENKVVRNIIRSVKSVHEDKKYWNILKSVGHSGADRMNSKYHTYAEWYSIFLEKYTKENIILCEVGILTGVGLSIWCDIFDKSNCIIGYDIDTSIFEKNKSKLIELGAFSKKSPKIYSFDQFEDNTEYIKNNTNGEKISIVIDDGNHVTKANLQTFNSFLPLLADDFVYIIEDNAKGVHKELNKIYYNKFFIYYKDQLTVITSKNGKRPIPYLKKYLLK